MRVKKEERGKGEEGEVGEGGENKSGREREGATVGWGVREESEQEEEIST